MRHYSSHFRFSNIDGGLEMTVRVYSTRYNMRRGMIRAGWNAAEVQILNAGYMSFRSMGGDKKMFYAELFFCEPRLGGGIVAHEIYHAVMDILQWLGRNPYTRKMGELGAQVTEQITTGFWQLHYDGESPLWIVHRDDLVIPLGDWHSGRSYEAVLKMRTGPNFTGMICADYAGTYSIKVWQHCDFANAGEWSVTREKRQIADYVVAQEETTALLHQLERAYAIGKLGGRA